MIEKLYFAIVVLAVLAVLYLVIEKGRSRDLKEFARRKLLRYSPEGASDEINGKLPVSAPIADGAYNIMTGEVEGVRATVFDFLDPHGEGFLRTPLDQTYLIFESEDLQFPEFKLQPRRMIHKMGKLVGSQDIPLPGSEALSKRYVIHGKETARIQRMFNSPVISFLESNAQVFLEGKENSLKFYMNFGNVYPLPRVPASGMQQYFDEGLLLLRAFKEAARENPSPK